VDLVAAVVADRQPLVVVEPSERALDDPAGATEAGAVFGLAAFARGIHGMYRISVRDTSPSNDFHLVGPGVNIVVTGVRFVGPRTVQVTLEPGTYRYRSDTHSAIKGGLVVF
jgi:hypothetical protein